MASLTPDNPFDTQQPKPASGGIVGGAMQTATPTSGELPSNVGTSAPASPAVATYAPTTRQLNQQTDTVQGQVDSILSKDNPLMQRARTLATQQMAQRGLVNSSMAAGAGTAAMIDRATPIATQDANAYNQVGSENMAAINNSGQFNAQQINQLGLQKQAQGFTSEQASLDRSQQTGLQTMQQNFSAAQTALDRAQQAYLQDKSATNQMALQTAQQNFTATQTALDRSQQTNLQNDQQAFQQSMTQMQQSFTSAQAALDRSQQAYLQDDMQSFQSAMQKATLPANFASQISTSLQQSVSAIAADPNLSGTADSSGTSPKSRAIQSAINYANSQISWANTFYQTNMPNFPGQ
jgi:hypothetical protein